MQARIKNPWIIGVSIIWAAVIITTATTLQGTPYLSQILPILGGGATGSLVILIGVNPRK